MKKAELYRGENMDYNCCDLGFIPSAYRKCKGNDCCKCATEHVNYMYDAYKDIFEQFRLIDLEKDSESVVAKKQIKRVGVMQHYGMQTPILDVTEDENVALFFACDGMYSKDGYLYTFEESMMKTGDGKIVRNRMDAIWNNKIISENLRLTKKPYCFDYTSLFSTNADNIRYQRQRGWFILHGYEVNDQGILPIYPKCKKHRAIPYKEKIMKLLELVLKKGITKEYLFPDWDDMIKLIVNYKRLRENGFEGYEYFTAEEPWRKIESQLVQTKDGYVFAQTCFKDFYHVISHKNQKHYTEEDKKTIQNKMLKMLR